ncbi:MAG: galactose mutarotase [Lachnospiraceae bacterium]|nr:galactose mutarotase [Lachnospiraceae bacterium]
MNCYTISNGAGLEVKVLDRGCIIRDITIDGRSIVATHETLEEYEKNFGFYGAFVGRFGNRILNAEFELNGKKYKLPENDHGNHLHGVLCKTEFELKEQTDNKLVFTYHSPDGEEGYPGNVDFTATYLLEGDTLTTLYEAVSDQDTILNLTNHTYWKLGEDQTLQLNADRYLEGDEKTCPTGNVLSVDGTVYDFRQAKKIDNKDPELSMYHCFDNCIVFEDNAAAPQATVVSEENKLKMELTTNQVSIQVFSGNPNGLALEPEAYPCAPNFPQFPSTVVKAGEKYEYKTSYKFTRL